MNKPHKWQKEISHWAAGGEVQRRMCNGKWADDSNPTWHPDINFRIKPEEPEYKPQPGDLVIGTQASGNEVMGTFTAPGDTCYVNNLVGIYICGSCKLHPKQILINEQARLIKEHEQVIDKIYEYFNERGM